MRLPDGRCALPGAPFVPRSPRHRLWLPGNFGSKRRTKKTLPTVCQRIAPLTGKLPEAWCTLPDGPDGPLIVCDQSSICITHHPTIKPTRVGP